MDDMFVSHTSSGSKKKSIFFRCETNCACGDRTGCRSGEPDACPADHWHTWFARRHHYDLAGNNFLRPIRHSAA